MTAIQDMSTRADGALKSLDSIPRFPEEMQRLLKEYRDAGLDQQAAQIIHEARKWQARKVGFELVAESAWDYANWHFGIPDMDRLLTQLAGAPPTSAHVERNNSQSMEWIWHHLYEQESVPVAKRAEAKQEADRQWTGNTRNPIRYRRKTGWLRRRGGYDWVLWNLNELIKPIPFGVMLKIAEAKRSRLFNCFAALAPRDCFGLSERPVIDADPVVFAVQYGFVANSNGHFVNSGDHAYFFLGQWE